MKKLQRLALLVWALPIGLFVTPSAHAFESIEVSGQYPVALGDKAQNFNSNFGVGASLYFDRLLDPSVPNYVSIGYNSFALKVNSDAAFRVFPIVVGADFEGKVFSDLKTVFGAAIGGAIGYIAVPNATTFNMSGYFVGQIKPGLEYDAGDDFSITARMPLTVLAGKASMSYLTYQIGVKMKL